MDFNEFALDLLVDDREMDFLEDTPVFRPQASSSEVQKNIEFFFSPDMSCPIDGCPPALVLSTKAKYQRHWTEKHLPELYLILVQFSTAKCLAVGGTTWRSIFSASTILPKD